MLIDEAQITVKAGHGGDGRVHFYRDRHRPKGGPDGGDGGDGGSVYFLAQSDISLLNQFRFKKEFKAKNGSVGGTNQKNGKNGQDLIFEVPVGTVVNYDNGTSVELTHTSQKVLIVKGGQGGRGNHSLRSSTNTTPKTAESGQQTQKRKLFVELKLIADVGLIGLPNAGKTSLLNQLTRANAKVASYAFTTLEPNLGVAKGNIIIADIPGLIEGASSGKGLGHKFLKHIERTRLLVHCLSLESVDLKKDHQTIRSELKNYSSTLAKKPELIILTKSDLSHPTPNIKSDLTVSIYDPSSIKKLQSLISSSLAHSPKPSSS